MNASPAVFTSVSKSFGRTTVLHELDLTIRPGETLALLGPNGAGKTTALRILLGIATPDRGTATIFGCNPRSYVARRRIGAMLQTGGVPPMLSVRELVTLFASYYPHAPAVSDTLDRAGVTEFANRRFSDISGGQQQRALFALALAGDPDLLVLDEPTNALDVEARRLLWRAIKSFARDGRSVLLATHDLTEAERIADRIAVLRGGRVAAIGTTHELIARSNAASFEGAVLALAGIAAELEVVA